MKVFAAMIGLLAGVQALAQNEKLMASIPAKETLQIVDARTRTCTYIKDEIDMDNLNPHLLEIPNIRLEWPSPNESFSLTSIKLTLQSPDLEDGEFECEAFGAELEAMGSPGWTEFSPNSVHANDCPLKCGSIKFNGAPTPGAIKGILEFTGDATDVRGKSRERKSKIIVKVLTPH